ncbi:MAG: helix-turn-helix transcriptional regulator [Monoglobaceae bacterium]
MSETMGDIIRKLRKERDLTQEELADKIGVTSQAVSKWENSTGMPDISQVVPLAAFFGVSTDTLFNYCSEDIRRDIENLKAESQKMKNQGIVDKRISLWRETVKKYPGKYECMAELAAALFDSFGDDTAKECIELCEKILSGSSDSSIREIALQIITYAYCSPRSSMADEEKAVYYANTASNIWCSREILLEKAYFTEESQSRQTEIRDQNILSFTDLICRKLSFAPGRSSEEQLQGCNAALTFWNTLIPDGNYLFYHCRISDIYKRIAIVNAKEGNKAETLAALKKAAYHALQFDKMPQGRQHFTSPLVKHAVSDSLENSKNYRETEFELFTRFLNEPRFDFIRNEEGFASLYKSSNK